MEKQLKLFDFDDQSSIISRIEDLFLPQEYFEVEYKCAREGFPKDFWKSYSAFANTNTGFIILGIAETKNGLNVEGFDDVTIQNYKKKFWDDSNNPNTVSVNLLGNDDVRELEIADKKVMVFRIPFAARTQRPVYLTRNPFGNTYKRNHEGDYRCTDEEVKRMIADSSGDLKRDSLILENYSTDDFDAASVRQFRQLFISSKPTHPWNALSDGDLFKKIGATRKERSSGKEGITLAGLLMFGKAESIKEQDALPDFFLDFREKLSKDENIRWTDRIFPDGTWESNLLQFYLKVWPKISSTLPKPFMLKDDERIDESPTHTALREAFVNALVHADYSLSGNIIVELDSEKFVFSNPGTLLVSLAQYYEGGISECRNPALQQMFMLIGRAEKAGSGVDKIMSGWKSSHWRRPYLELESQPDRVKLTLPMFSILPGKILNELHQRFNDIDDFTPDELTALSFCHIEGSISNNRLQYVLNMHPADITTLLKGLLARGYLESENKGRWTMYKIRENDVTSGLLSYKEVASSEGKVATSKAKVATSEKKDATSDKKVATSKEVPSKMKRNDLELVIMRYCKNTYRNKEELATFLGKSETYLRNKILPEMENKEMIRKKYPYTQNHPEQAYKTTEEYAAKL
ncbi:MAG: putative DNA binding domain-containing protein [Weeksellaceae bacterium]|nr:putative DNA binding domain-containing protein [Weeksellaceae bacterium]